MSRYEEMARTRRFDVASPPNTGSVGLVQHQQPIVDELNNDGGRLVPFSHPGNHKD